MIRSSSRCAAISLAALVGAAACSSPGDADANVARGRGLRPAGLAPAAEAQVYDAAARAAFDVTPELVLLLHPRRLPRTSGTEGGDPVPADVVSALRARGLVRGTCEPRRDAPRDTPRCDGTRPGYVVRGSDVLRVSPDTVEVYLNAEAFAPASGQKPPALRFEKIYQLSKSNTGWGVVREARVPGAG